MAVVIKYTKAQYQAKIDELEAYYSELARDSTNASMSDLLEEASSMLKLLG